MTDHSSDPVVRWMFKHSSDPFTAGKRWITEHFQFGICMFDPSGLKERYARLVGWEGLWVNYWTETFPRVRSKVGGREEDMVEENDLALLQVGVAPEPAEMEPASSSVAPKSSNSPPPSSPPISLSVDSQTAPTKAEMKVLEKERRRAEKDSEKLVKQREKERRQAEKELAKLAKRRAKEEKGKEEKGRHFVVLPTGLGQVLGGGEHWEKVLVSGVEDEVAAHTGLFIRDQNLDYDGLVKRVGGRILAWCEDF